jgi:hypothetical protein
MGRIMRQKDRIEIRASGNFEPEKAVRASINRSSEAWALYAGDYLLGVFGVSKPPGVEWVVPWAMTSAHVNQFPLTFYRTSKEWTARWQTKYPYMVQMVHGAYTEALSWLKRLGFKIEAPEVYGKRGELFCRVTLVTPRLILEGG